MLRLLDSLHAVHPVFHVSMLEPAIPNLIPDRIQPPPPPITVDDELKFEISEILDSKIDNHCRTCKLLYLVRWTGYEGTDEETSWILLLNLDMLPNWSRISTLHIQPNLALCQVFLDSDLQPSGVLQFLRITLFFYVQNILNYYLL